MPTSSGTGSTGYPATPDSEFARLLGLVPTNAADIILPQDAKVLTIWYADRAGEASAAGQKIPMSIEEVMSPLTADDGGMRKARLLMATYPYITAHPIGMTGQDPQRWRDTLGYDPYVLERDLFIGQGNSFRAGVNIQEGAYPTDVVAGKLKGFGYQARPSGVLGYGDERGIHMDMAPKLLDLLRPDSMMNRVGLAERTIITGNSEALVDAVYKARVAGRAEKSFLRDSVAGQFLNAVGAAHLAVLIPLTSLHEVQDRVNPPHRFVPPADWGTLHAYAWAGLAYTRDSLDKAHFTVALMYDDPQAAQADAAELSKRFSSYRPLSFPLEGDDPRKPTTLADDCTPAQPKVTSGAWGSTLALTCAYDPLGEDRAWFRFLLEAMDIDFLRPDLRKAE
jgi:hypothetical protein